jgi:hypothetical protein
MPKRHIKQQETACMAYLDALVGHFIRFTKGGILFDHELFLLTLKIKEYDTCKI